MRTPPFGTSIFTLKATLNDSKVSVESIFAGTMPFVAVMLLMRLPVALVPALPLALVRQGRVNPMRLFIALWPPPEVREAIATAAQVIAWPAGARPIAQSKLHLTLHFLGDVDDSTVPALRDALAVRAACFELRLDRLQAWPGGWLVLCPGGVPAALVQLHADLAQRLSALGLRVEARAFKPHVTLARHAPAGCAQHDLTPVQWPVRGHALVCSEPQRGYAVLQAWDAEPVGRSRRA